MQFNAFKYYFLLHILTRTKGIQTNHLVPRRHCDNNNNIIPIFTCVTHINVAVIRFYCLAAVDF